MHKLCIHIEGDRRDRGGKDCAVVQAHDHPRITPPPLPLTHPVQACLKNIL